MEIVERINNWIIAKEGNRYKLIPPADIIEITEGDTQRLKDEYWTDKIIQIDFSNCPNLNKIGYGAFRGFRMIDTLDLSMLDSLESIGDWAFAYCGIERVRFPKNIEEIGKYAFVECNWLREVDFLQCRKLRLIDEYSFLACDIRNVKFPQSVRTLGKRAFSLNKNLYEIDISECDDQFSVRGCLTVAFADCNANISHCCNVLVNKNLRTPMQSAENSNERSM